MAEKLKSQLSQSGFQSAEVKLVNKRVSELVHSCAYSAPRARSVVVLAQLSIRSEVPLRQGSLFNLIVAEFMRENQTKLGITETERRIRYVRPTPKEAVSDEQRSQMLSVTDEELTEFSEQPDVRTQHACQYFADFSNRCWNANSCTWRH